MRTVKTVMICTAVALVTGLTASPAAAAPSDTTTTTFSVTGGTLDIDAPASSSIGSGAPGTVIIGQMGTITVTDSRAAADATWLAIVSSTDYTNGASTVPASAVEYWSGPATATTGNGTFTPGQLTSADADPLAAVPITAFTHTGGTGNNTAAWNPTLEISVPMSAASGTYTGTVTHSVA